MSPDMRQTVIEAMRNVIRERAHRESLRWKYSVEAARTWWDVTVKNTGDVPIKKVILRFPRAEYRINNERLVPVYGRIELGDMEQRSQISLTFWGDLRGSFQSDEEIVLGHAEGVGSVDYK